MPWTSCLVVKEQRLFWNNLYEVSSTAVDADVRELQTDDLTWLSNDEGSTGQLWPGCHKCKIAFSCQHVQASFKHHKQQSFKHFIGHCNGKGYTNSNKLFGEFTKWKFFPCFSLDYCTSTLEITNRIALNTCRVNMSIKSSSWEKFWPNFASGLMCPLFSHKCWVQKEGNFLIKKKKIK